eukprot:TRINITY_DN11680_c0_g1_i6.p1 TRINITY_DN11680_c0_g1~~TRINITY_DN11680_c0_g1_i6.p1  ORF type:complete len:616 (+),score=113.90 TRINITY_DN11680_c0_g1_i6:157-2004(+)
MATQKGRGLKRSAASVRVKTLSSPFRQDHSTLAALSHEELAIHVQNHPDEAAKIIRDLVHAQRFSSAMLDMNVALMETNDLTQLMTNIMQHAAELIDCERCSIFMYDKTSNELVAKVFDVTDGGAVSEESEPIRFPANTGIAGHVASTGQTLSIPDAYSDERFNRSVDEKTGFKTRNILCMPIFNAEKEVLAIAQLVNKRDGACFSPTDQQSFELFAAYCGLALQNAQLYDQLKRDAARRQVALEMISYHTGAHPTEVDELAKRNADGALADRLRSVTFDPLTIEGDETLVACKAMFRDSGLARTFRIPHETLCAWLICVRRSYRDVRYHNWKHAFNVGQFIYGLITSSEIGKMFSDTEKLGFLVAALSHDLDHRGTNNAFEKKYSTALGDLYSTSTLERHHFDRALSILNTEGHNILTHVPTKQYNDVVRFIEKAILATDLGKHFKHRQTYKELVESGKYDAENPDHKFLLRNVLMTAADLSATTKPFPAQRRVAELVYSEFFDQGDLEKALGTSPEELQDLLNRQKVADLPKMQIGFLDFVAGPVYETLGKQFEDLAILRRELERNRKDWVTLQEAGPYEFVTPISVLTSKTKSDAMLKSDHVFKDTIAVDEV